MKDGRPHFTEINARLGSGVTLGIAAGADSPRWLLAYAVGLDEPVAPLGAYKKDLYLTRCEESFFIGGQERRRLVNQRI
jgi:carbamoyl-phosphate synthase large subunit